MPMINSTAPQYLLDIAGEDFTDQLADAQFQLNDGQADSAGLALLAGQLVLQSTIGLADSLDPRLNGLLSIGAQVQITEAISSDKLALFGTMYIAGLSYNEQDLRLTIGLACTLSMLNFASSAEIGACIDDPEAGDDKADIIAELLESAGLSPSDIDVSNIPGKIFEPVLIQATQSFISTAGQLAISEGYCLYQTNEGLVIAEQVLESRTNRPGNVFQLDAIDLIEYESLPSSSSIPPAKLKVTGNRLWPKNPRQTVSTETESDTGFGTRKETNTRSYSPDTRTAREVTKISEQVGVFTNLLDSDSSAISRTTTIRETYEQKPAELVRCDEPDEGRLIERKTTVAGSRIYFLQEFYQTRSASIEDGLLSDFQTELLSKMIGEEITETWRYDTPDNSPICGSLNVAEDGSLLNSHNLPENFSLRGYSVKYERKVRKAYGTVLPLTGDNKLGRDPDIEDAELLVFPTLLIDAEETTSTWRLNGDGESWNLESETKIPSYQLRPQGIQDIIGQLDREQDNYVYTMSQVMLQARQKVIGSSTSVSHTSAGEGGRYPSNIRYGRTPYKIEAKINAGESGVAQRTASRAMSDETPIGKIDNFAGVILSRQWGQAYGKLITFPANIMLGQNLALLNACDIAEPSGAIYCYEMSGISLSLTKTQAIFACIGWLVGQRIEGEQSDIVSVWSNGLTVSDSLVFSESAPIIASTGDLIIEEPSSLLFESTLSAGLEPEQELTPIDNFNALDDILAQDGRLFEATGIA